MNGQNRNYLTKKNLHDFEDFDDESINLIKHDDCKNDSFDNDGIKHVNLLF